MTSPNAAVTSNKGRIYKIPDPHTRVLLDLPSWSTLKRQEHSFTLERWKQEKIARAVAGSPALQAQAADPDVMVVRRAVAGILEKDTEAADLGTAVHSMLERLETGELDREFVAPVLAPFLKAYEECKARFGFEVVASEQTIYNLTEGYAGSADMWVRLPRPLMDTLERTYELAPGGTLVPGDYKTGANVYDDTALQLRAYSGGDGIVTAPSKLDLGFTLREAQLEDDIRNGVGFDRINPKRRTWSAEAVREAKAALEAEWWEAYTKLCEHHPMPEGLRRDIGIVVHLHHHDDRYECRLVPLRLDGDDASGGTARGVIIGLVDRYQWGKRRDIILPALVPAVEGSINVQVEATVAPADSGDGRGAKGGVGAGGPKESGAERSGEDERDAGATGGGAGHEAGGAGSDDQEPGIRDIQEPCSGADDDTIDHMSVPRLDAPDLQAAQTVPTGVAPLPAGWRPGDPATDHGQSYTENGATYRPEMLCRDWLRECTKALTRPQQSRLLEVWPHIDGAKIPRIAECVTAVQLDGIRQAIQSVAGIIDLPWPDDHVVRDRAADAEVAARVAEAFTDTADTVPPVVDPDDAPASAEAVSARVEWLKDIRANRPEMLAALRTELDGAGITKSLLRDTWTVGELRRWVRVAAQVDRPQ